MTAPGHGSAPAGDALPSPLTSVDDMRATAKWTLAVAGVTGAALISGWPLVAVGQVHGIADSALAGVGLAGALAGVGLALWSTSRVLMPRLTTPAVFTERRLATLTDQIDQHPAYFFGELATSVSDLLARRAKTLDGAQKVAEALAASGDAELNAQLQVALARLQSDRARIDACLRSLLPLAHAWLVEADLKRSRLWTLAGGALVVAGAVLFFSVTGSSAH